MNSDENIKQAVKKRFKFPVIWLTPMLAAVITLWLLYSGYINSGTEIRIQFESGSDIVEGKTQVKYRGLNVGKVTKVRISDRPDLVDVYVELLPEADIVSREGMTFWIVKPRLGFNKISGLETIISGSYIEVMPPTYDKEKLEALPKVTTFIGLSEPPEMNTGGEYMSVHLQTSENINIFKGVPVFYKGQNAGQVSSVKYRDNESNYYINLSIDNAFQKYIDNETKFWNISGFQFSYDKAGISFDSIPLGSILNGGIAFDNLGGKPDGLFEPSQIFKLYSSKQETMLSDKAVTLKMPSSGGIEAGRTKIFYKGIPVGLVTNVALNSNMESVTAEIRMLKNFDGFLHENTVFTLAEPKLSLSGVKNISSVITGVYLEIYPGDGAECTKFELSSSAPYKGETRGTEISFISDRKGSLEEGSGIFFKNIRIGRIKSAVLTDSGKVKFSGIIFEMYASLTAKNLMFWRSEGLNFSVSNRGVTVDTESAETFLKGGVIAELFPGKFSGKVRTLYESRTEAEATYIRNSGNREILLRADNLDGLTEYSPVYYKGVQVGELGKAVIDRKIDSVLVKAYIYKEYAGLLTDSSLFYEAGVMEFSANTEGMKFQTPALDSVVRGGVEFINPDIEMNAPENGIYPLFSSRSEMEKQTVAMRKGTEFRLKPAASQAPAAGTPVYYNNSEAGYISGVSPDAKTGEPVVTAKIFNDYTKFVTDRTRFWFDGGLEIEAGAGGITFKSKPLIQYVKGAVCFDTFKKSSDKFILYSDLKSAEKPDKTIITVTLHTLMNFSALSRVVSSGTDVAKIDNVEFEHGKTVLTLIVNDSFESFFRDGALFWSEDMEISLDGVKNLDSVIKGPRLVMLPGTGEKKYSFTALSSPPTLFYGSKGKRIILESDSRMSLEPGSPVYYRQVEVGAVESLRLSEHADKVLVTVFIQEEYKRLVRKNSIFWNAGGIGTKLNLFGVKVKTESVKTILKGGIAFATPDEPEEQAEENSVFELYKSPKKRWLEYAPKL
jgi:paraquat-inducible protein B